jgi:zinc transport system substrate-binding protein
MKKILSILAVLLLISCKTNNPETGAGIISVSIAPYKYFIEKIAGNDFTVNIMVPPGASPHIYEPYPEQIDKLRKSIAYISNGFLGFEMTWLDRFYEMNQTMKKLSVGDKMDPILSEHHHEGEHAEGADPHFWVSPQCALIIASSVKSLLCELNPAGSKVYTANYDSLTIRINEVGKMADTLFSPYRGKIFMIYHPNLAYLARDYGLTEIPVEYEGKEPPPSRLKELIDLARKEKLKTIFVQKEYDSKNANAIAQEIGAKVRVINPLSEDWYGSTTEIIKALNDSFAESK